MTYEEALELLKDHEYWADISAIDDACDVAIKSLEKQIPMKPKYICNDAYCICGNAVRRYSKFCDEYCDHCGQKIDWSD